MLSRYLRQLVSRRTPVYFISPHLDDAAFSAGALIAGLSRTNPVTVVNVFTRPGSGPQTLSARAFVNKCGETDAARLFSKRRSEDQAVFAKIGAKVINLGFTDALWRRHSQGGLIPELDHIYPVFRLHARTGLVAPSDQPTHDQLSSRLAALIPPSAVVFCPRGVGRHVDHLVVRNVCEQLFFGRLVYWLDYPYFTTEPALEVFEAYDSHLGAKQRMIEGYVSQRQVIFGGTFPKALPDRFILPPSPSVSVLIPTRNQADNLSRLINDLQMQSVSGFKFDNLTVFSDASPDDTNLIVSKFKSPLVHLLTSHRRLGRARAANHLLSQCRSDIAILLSDQIRVLDSRFLVKTVSEFLRSGSDLASFRVSPPRPGFWYKLGLRLAELYRFGRHVYTCSAAARVFGRDLYSRLKLRDPGDAFFSYQHAQRHGFSYTYLHNVSVVSQQLRFNWSWFKSSILSGLFIRPLSLLK